MKSKTFFTIGTLVVAGSLLTGYTLTKADEESKTVQPKTTIEEPKNVSATITDVTEFQSVNAYFSHFVERFNASTPTSQSEIEHVKSAGYSEGYYYYLQAMALKDTVVKVQTDSEELKKDIRNLGELADIIMVEELKQPKGSTPTERMNQAIEYTKQLLTDVNISLGGTGKYFGASNVGGGNTKPIEDFINGGE